MPKKFNAAVFYLSVLGVCLAAFDTFSLVRDIQLISVVIALLAFLGVSLPYLLMIFFTIYGGEYIRLGVFIISALYAFMLAGNSMRILSTDINMINQAIFDELMHSLILTIACVLLLWGKVSNVRDVQSD